MSSILLRKKQMRSVSDLLRDTRVRRAAAWSPRGADSSSVLNVIAGNYDCGLKCVKPFSSSGTGVGSPTGILTADAVGVISIYSLYFTEAIDVVNIPPEEFVLLGTTLAVSSTKAPLSSADYYAYQLAGLDTTTSDPRDEFLLNFPPNPTRQDIVDALNSAVSTPMYLISGVGQLRFSLDSNGHLEMRYFDYSAGGSGDYSENPNPYIVGIFFGDAPNVSTALGITDGPIEGVSSTGIFLEPGQEVVTAPYLMPTV